MSQHGGCLVDMGSGSGGNISPGEKFTKTLLWRLYRLYLRLWPMKSNYFFRPILKQAIFWGAGLFYLQKKWLVPKMNMPCKDKSVTIPGTLGKRTRFKQMQMLRKIYELKNVNAFEDIRKYEKSWQKLRNMPFFSCSTAICIFLLEIQNLGEVVGRGLLDSVFVKLQTVFKNGIFFLFLWQNSWHYPTRIKNSFGAKTIKPCSPSPWPRSMSSGDNFYNQFFPTVSES